MVSLKEKYNMVDLTTKTILIVIALGIWLNLAKPILTPPSARAADSYTCKGELKANAWGGTKESIGGYNVDLTCD
jgi:hypothetical protein